MVIQGRVDQFRVPVIADGSYQACFYAQTGDCDRMVDGFSAGMKSNIGSNACFSAGRKFLYREIVVNVDAADDNHVFFSRIKRRLDGYLRIQAGLSVKWPDLDILFQRLDYGACNMFPESIIRDLHIRYGRKNGI